MKKKSYDIGGLFSEQVGVTDEQAKFWWASRELKKDFVFENGFDEYEDAEYNELPIKIKHSFKTWLIRESITKAKSGMKLYGPSHDNGGIAGHVRETK